MSASESSDLGQAPRRTNIIGASGRGYRETTSRYSLGNRSLGLANPLSESRHGSHSRRVDSDSRHSCGTTSQRRRLPSPPPGVGNEVRRTVNGLFFSVVDLVEQLEPDFTRVNCRRRVKELQEELKTEFSRKVVVGGTQPTPCADAATCERLLAWYPEREQQIPEAPIREPLGDSGRSRNSGIRVQDTPFCIGRQDFGSRALRCAGNTEILDEEEVMKIEDEAERDRIWLKHMEEVVAVDDKERFKKTLKGIEGMLDRSPSIELIPPKLEKVRFEESMLHFDFAVGEGRVCSNSVRHKDASGFSVILVGRDCYDHCKGPLCANKGKQWLGRLELGAALEKADIPPVSQDTPSVLNALDSLPVDQLKNIHRSHHDAALVFVRANDDGRILVDCDGKFWVWNGRIFDCWTIGDMTTLTSKHLQTIAWGVQLRSSQVPIPEEDNRGSSDGDSDDSNGSVGQKRPAPVRGPRGSSKRACGAVHKALGTGGFVKNVLEFARNELKEPDVLASMNQTPTLLPCANGVLNLETGLLEPFHPRFLHTYKLDVQFPSVEPQPGAFRAFIEDIFNHDVELLSYLQMLMGYWITGDTSQSVFTLMVSPGSSGKTVLVSLLHSVLGGFFYDLPSEAITGPPKPNGAPDPNIISMQGRRLAIAEETKDGAKFNEERVKGLTGDGRVSARGVLAKSPTSVKITAKIVASTNHLPRFSGDFAMIRRTIVLPFPNRYVPAPDENNPSHRLQDPMLNEKLSTEEAKEEALYWLAQGAKRFYEKKNAGDGAFLRTDMPQVCKEALKEYVNDNAATAAKPDNRVQEVVRPFIDAHCEVAKDNMEMFETPGRLFAAFRATPEGASCVMSVATFGKALVKLGFANTGENKVYNTETGQQERRVYGIRLKE